MLAISESKFDYLITSNVEAQDNACLFVCFICILDLFGVDEILNHSTETRECAGGLLHILTCTYVHTCPCIYIPGVTAELSRSCKSKIVRLRFELLYLRND